MNGIDRNAGTVAGYAHYLSHFNMVAFPALALPITRAMNRSLADVIGMSWLMYLFFGLAALPWGWAADRYGAKPLMVLFFLGAGSSGILVASSIHAGSHLPGSLALLGLFSSIYHPVGLGLISGDSRRAGTRLGVNGAIGTLGIATAPFVVGLANWLWDPRGSFAFLGALNLLGLALMTVLPFQSRVVRARTGHDHRCLWSGSFLILMGMGMLGGIIYRGALFTLPAYLELVDADLLPGAFRALQGMQSGNLTATALASMVFLIAIMGPVAATFAHRNRNPLGCYLFFHLLMIPAAILMGRFTNGLLLAVAIAYFVSLFAALNLENMFIAYTVPRRALHSAYGIRYVLTFGAGAAAVKIVEALEEKAGLEWVFPILGGVSALVVPSLLLLVVHGGQLTHLRRKMDGGRMDLAA
jgi:FSR family fosmidomycin resistance protein-like MFS transporter